MKIDGGHHECWGVLLVLTDPLFRKGGVSLKYSVAFFETPPAAVRVGRSRKAAASYELLVYC